MKSSNSAKTTSTPSLDRRAFLCRSAVALAAAPLLVRDAESASTPRKIKVGVIGCGSVSRMSFPNLAACPHVELVSACDKIPGRAKRAAEKFRLPNHYPGIEPMLAGYDWGPHAVDLSTAQEPKFKRHADAKHNDVWECGASLCAECLVTGKEPLFTPEHGLHVVEIITAARASQVAGKHVKLTSTFEWPVVG